jgi:hypothetical protein
MLWEGFRDRGIKARLAEALEGILDAKAATAGDVALSPLSTDGSPRVLDVQGANADNKTARCQFVNSIPSHAQEADADAKTATCNGADTLPERPKSQGAKGAAAGAALEDRSGGGADSGELEVLDTSGWGEKWCWRDRPEFKPAGQQPQGWRWVLARLKALAIEERGPWLRTLTWQDRVTGCIQQVREQHDGSKPLYQSPHCFCSRGISQ